MSKQPSIPSIADRIYLRVAGRSWRIRHSTSRIIDVSGRTTKLRIPITKGVGYGNVFCGREILYPLLAWLTHCRMGAFVDVGANIGQTLLVALLAGSIHRYVGFEPNTFCCSYLQELIDLNNLRHCLVLPVGLSERLRTADLYCNGAFDVCASTTPGFRPAAFFENRQQAVLVPGDDVLGCCELDDIAIMKIDVEGGELEVIMGIRETIGKYKPILLLEVLPYLHIENDKTVFPDITEEERRDIVSARKERTAELESLVRELDYVWYRIEANGDLTPTPFMGTDDPERRTEMNFLAVHDSGTSDLEACAAGRLRRPSGA